MLAKCLTEGGTYTVKSADSVCVCVAVHSF